MYIYLLFNQGKCYIFNANAVYWSLSDLAVFGSILFTILCTALTSLHQSHDNLRPLEHRDPAVHGVFYRFVVVAKIDFVFLAVPCSNDVCAMRVVSPVSLAMCVHHIDPSSRTSLCRVCECLILATGKRGAYWLDFHWRDIAIMVWPVCRPDVYSRRYQKT